MVISLASAVADQITANAGKGPVPPCRQIIVVMATCLELCQCLQDTQALWATVSLLHDLTTMEIMSAGEFSFEDKIRQSRVLSCCRGHEPPLAVEAAGQYMALAFCKPVPRLLPMLTSKKQDSSSLMRHWPAASTSSSEHLHVGKQQQAPTAPPGRTGLPRAWLYATLVSRVLPNGE